MYLKIRYCVWCLCLLSSSFLPYIQTNIGIPCVDEATKTIGCCRLLADCPSAVKKLELYRTRPTTCSFIKDAVVVCCKDSCTETYSTESLFTWNIDEATNRQIPTNFRSHVVGMRISERKCKDYNRLRSIEANDVITFKSDKKYYNTELQRHIAGGTDAHLGEFPHMAAIGWYLNQSQSPVFLCGGTLISENFVLTASHCASTPVNEKQIKPSIVRLGDHNIRDDVQDGANPVDVRIKIVLKHPEYKAPMKYNDIALIEMVTGVKFTSNIFPACLYTGRHYKKLKIAVVTGWGSTVSGEQKNSAVLQKAVISIIDTKLCGRLWDHIHNRNFPTFKEYQICAGVLKGGIDTCQGDSGGPLQVSIINNVKQYYVIGVISFGKDCAKADLPGIYTIIPYFLDWIEATVWS